MRFIATPGKNFKNYVKIILENKNDLENLEYVRKILSRTEFKPFIKSFNKNISETYLIDETFFPAQLWQDVYKGLKEIMPNVKLENNAFLYNNIKKYEIEEFAETLNLPTKYDLFKDEYFYQLESVYRALLFKQSRIEVSTGGGKTMITYLYCRYLIDKIISSDKKILIIINRKDLVRQTATAFDEFDIFNDKPLKIESIYSGAKKVANANIIIGTYQSLKNYEKEYFDDFSCVICDEAHSAKAYSVRNDIYSKCFNAEYLFSMTATYPEYKTLDYLSIVSMFGPLVFVKDTYDLIQDGNITPVFINKIKINYNDENKNFSENLIQSGIIGVEKYRIEKVFFQNYEPRTKLITKIINGFIYNHLILVESVEYCNFLKEFISKHCPDKYVDVIYGQISTINRDVIKLAMEERENMVLIATYETMSTGVSINNIHHVHFPNGGRSIYRIKQGTGRGVRLHKNKKILNIFDYQDNMSKSSYKNHAKERNLIYENEKHPSKEIIVNI